MRVETIGDGEAEYVIIGLVHGDEPCGREAIERFLESGVGLKAPVKFIIANEEAEKQGVRFIDTDLNRSFPGDRESKSHEERLAAVIMEEIRGKTVFDIHSTRSHPEPFATLSYLNQDTLEFCRSAGVENIVYFPEEAGALNEQTTGIVVEVGYQGTDEASERAYEVLLNFLGAEGIIDRDYDISEPVVLQYYDTVEGRGYEFIAENFEKVRKGEVFARRNGQELVAEEDFYPVLMSTEGYEDILGYKARKLDEEELERYLGKD